MISYLDASQLVNLAIATATNIGAIYLSITYILWTRRLRHSRTSLRPLIASLAMAKGALWFWTFSNILNITIGDADLPLETLPARLFWLVVVIWQWRVVTAVRPAPMLPESLEAEFDRDGRLVLIVDDDDGYCRLYRRILEQVGINAEFAHTGRDALIIIEIEKPRLLVVDLVLPDMDGVELVRRARALGYKGPAVSVSGGAALFPEQALADAAFSEVVGKPIPKAEFVALVQRWAK